MRKKLVLALTIFGIVRALWEPRRDKRRNLKAQVNNWENEGGQVPGVPPPRDGR